MATKMLEVQQKVFEALDKNSELKKKVKGVFDYVPENTPTPYITFGDTTSTSVDTKVENGEKLTINFDVWSQTKGRKEAVQILTLMETILKASFNLSAAYLISQKVITREVTEETYGLYHGILAIEYEIEWEE